MARAVPVDLVSQTEAHQRQGLCAHTLHPGSTTGNEFNGFMWKGVSIGKAVNAPKNFAGSGLIVKLRHARPASSQGYAPQPAKPGFAMKTPLMGQKFGMQSITGLQQKKPVFGAQPRFGKQSTVGQFGKQQFPMGQMPLQMQQGNLGSEYAQHSQALGRGRGQQQRRF